MANAPGTSDGLGRNSKNGTGGSGTGTGAGGSTVPGAIADTDWLKKVEARFKANGQTMTEADKKYWATNTNEAQLAGAFVADRSNTSKTHDASVLTAEAYMSIMNGKQGSLGQDWLDFSKNQWELSTKRQEELDALFKQFTGDQLKLAQDQFAYTQKVTGQQMSMAQAQLDLTAKVTGQQMKIADWQFGIAKEDRDRYNTKFKPIEDQFIKEASEYGSPEAQAEAAAAAKADVLTAATEAKAMAQRQQAAMGINPNSGRFKGIDRAGELGTALASAGAQNNARTMVKDKGLALKADVANLGRGLGASSAQATALGLNAGNSALSGTTAATGMALGAGNSAISNMGSAAGLGIDARSNIIGMGQNSLGIFNNSTGIVNPGFAGAMTGYAGTSAGLQNMYNTQVGIQQNKDANKASNFNGIMGALGTGLGLFLSDENVKEDKQEIPDGEALEAVKSMPVESWKYKEGYADEGEHVGTYAQDFQAATGKGDGHSIPAQDAIGITMKAVQDLDSKVDKIAKAVGLGITPPTKKPAKAAPMKMAA